MWGAQGSLHPSTVRSDRPASLQSARSREERLWPCRRRLPHPTAPGTGEQQPLPKSSQGEPNSPAHTTILTPSPPPPLPPLPTGSSRLRKTNSELEKKTTCSCSWQSPGSQSRISPRRGSASSGASYVSKSKAGAIRAIQITHANGYLQINRASPSSPAETAREGMLSSLGRLGSAGRQPKEGMR